MRWSIGAALVCTLALAATPASARSDAWKTHTVRSAGFSVGAPDTWIDVTRLSPQVLAKMSQIPSLRDFVDLAKRSKVIKLILVDAGTTTVKNHYATNMNVVEAPTTADLQLLRDATIAQLKSLGVVIGDVQSAYVTLPAGKAVRLRYRARYGTATPVLLQQQYILLRGGLSAVLTYTTLPKLQSAYTGIFARSATSFRFQH
jgi:hypothetical protein